MGDQNAISLLRGINSTLQSILELQKSSNSTKKNEQNAKTTSTLSKGGLSNNPTLTNNDKAEVAGMTIADLSTLSNIPAAVKAVASINSKTMKNFASVMRSLLDVIRDYSELDKRTLNGIKGIESIANGLDTLSKTHLIKLGITLKLVNNLGISKSLGEFVKGVTDVLNDTQLPQKEKIIALTNLINNLTDPVKKLALMSPLMPMFLLSTKIMYPGFKTLGKSLNYLSSVKDPNAAISILREMNNFVKSSAILVGSTIALSLAISKFGIKNVIVGLSANIAIIGAVSLLAVATAKASSIMGRRSRKGLNAISEFSSGVLAVTMGIALTSILVGSYSEKITSGLPIVGGIFLAVSALSLTVGIVASHITRRSRRGFRSITNFAFSMIAVTGSLVLLSAVVDKSGDSLKNSFIILGGVILAVGVVALVAAGVGAIVKVTKPLSNEVIKIAAFGTALVLGTVLLGALIQQSGPMLAIGIGGVTAIIIAYGAAILIPTLTMGALAKAGAPLMMEFVKLEAFSLAITLGTILVGQVIKLDIEQNGGILNSAIFYGTAGVSALIIAYTAVIKCSTQIAKVFNEVGQKSMYDVMKLIGLGLTITVATVGVGILLKRHAAETALAFIGLTAIMIESLAIAQFSSKNKTALQKGIVDYKNVIILMGSAVVVLGSITGVGALIKAVGGGDYWKGFAYVSSVFGLMTAVVTEAVLLSRLASRSGKTIVKGAQSLLLAEGILLASEVVLFGAVMIAKQLDKDTIGKVALTFVGMGIIVNGAAALAKLASRKRSVITKGAASLLLAESIILGSAVILGSVVLLTNKLEKVGYDKAAITLGAMIGIVGLATGLALVASKIPKASITSGLITIGMIELLLVGSAIALGSIVLVTNKMKELGDGDLWKGFGQVNITLLTITELMVAFTGLAAAATFALPFITGGVAAIAMLDIFALGVSLFTLTIKGTVDRLNALGENPKEEMIKLRKYISAMGDVAGVVGILTPAWLLGSIGFAAMMPMIISLTVTTLSLVGVKKKLAEAGIEDAATLGEFAKSLSGIFKYDNFKLPLNALQIGALVLQYKGMKPVFDGLNKITKSISTLVSSVGGMDDNGRIIPIVGHDSAGNPIYGSPVDMAKVSRNIVDAIKIFGEIMSSDFAKIGSKDNKTLMEAFKSLSTIVEPISNFATALSSFEAGGVGKIRAIKFDENGKQINTPYVDVASVARTIGNSVLVFVETLFGADSTSKWIDAMSSGYEVLLNKKGKEVIGEKKSNAAVAMGVLSTIIDPVCSFVDTLTTFEEGDNGVLIVPIYDKDGKIIDKRHVNVERVARTIASAVSTFAEILFGSESASKWIEIITSGSQYVTTKKETTYLESDAQRAMGSLAELITPIVSFANMLSMFGDAADGNKLLVYDKDGKTHTVDVVKAAGSIANAIGQFIIQLQGSINEKNIGFIKDNSEVLSSIFSSFAQNIENIGNIDAKDLDSKISGITKVFDFIISKGDNNTTALAKSLSDALVSLSDPLERFINTFVSIATNDLGGNVDKFSTSLKTLNKTIEETNIASNNIDVNKLSTFFSSLFGQSINNMDLSGIDTIKTKFVEYEELLKSISSLEITDASFKPLNDTTTYLIIFGENLVNATDKFSQSVVGLNVFAENKQKIKDFINLLTDKDVNYKVNVTQLNSFGTAFKTFFGRMLEIADEINVESINVLDLQSKKIIDFVNLINENLTSKKLDIVSLAGFNNEFKKLVASIISVSTIDLTSSIYGVTTIKNSFDEFSGVINELNNVELSNVASTDLFNKSLNSLFTNILSMADKNKVVQSIQKTINLTTTSLTKLDNAFIKKNNERIKELNKLNETLKDLRDRLDDSSTGLGKLVDLVKALNDADEEKAQKILQSIGAAGNKAQSGGNTNPTRRGDRKGEQNETNVYTLTPEEVSNAVAHGIAMAFEEAQITIPEITIKYPDGNTSKLAADTPMQFDILNDSGNYYSE